MEHFVVSQIEAHGYLAIFILMCLESICLPIPSELIMAFGGALAGGLTLAGMHAQMSLIGVVLAGAVGNLLGALMAYAVGRTGGRPVIERWGHHVLIRARDLDRADRFFERRGYAAVLFARVLPVVRTFINLPAGIAKMPVLPFAALTFLGTLPWTFGFAFAGEKLTSNWSTVSEGFAPFSIAAGLLAMAAIGWWTVHRLHERRASLAGGSE